MSEYKYELVSLKELNAMSFGEVQKTEFYAKKHEEYINASTGNLGLYANEGRLHIRKKLNWWENIPEQGVLVWYKYNAYLVDYVECKKCFCNGTFFFEVHDCTPLTDEEVIKYFTRGEV